MRRVMVCSSKGGCGKTTMTVSLAMSLAEKGYKVGIVDGDMTTPDCHRLLRIVEDLDFIDDNGKIKIKPAVATVDGFNATVKLLSIGMIAPESPFLWESKYIEGAIDQIINNTLWGEVDILLIDSPPTLHIDFQKYARVADSALIVTLPDELSMLGASRCIEALSVIGTPVIGYVVNMSYLVCECGRVHRVFKDSNRALGIRKIGEVPIKNEKVFRLDFAERVLKEKPQTIKARRIKSKAAKMLLDILELLGGE